MEKASVFFKRIMLGLLLALLALTLLLMLREGLGSRSYLLAMALGLIACYALGTAWFMIQTGNGLVASLGLCVVPFLPGDAVKIAAASILAWPVRKAIER